MALNHLSSAAVRKDYLNINCNELKCASLDADDASLPYAISGHVGVLDTTLSATYAQISVQGVPPGTDANKPAVLDNNVGGIDIKVSGKYQVSLNVQFTSTSSLPSTMVALQISGGATLATQFISAGTSLTLGASVSSIVTLTAGDLVIGAMKEAASGSCDITSWELSAVKIS